MSDFWASRNGLDVAAAIIQIPRELKKIRELMEVEVRWPQYSTDPMAKTTISPLEKFSSGCSATPSEPGESTKRLLSLVTGDVDFSQTAAGVAARAEDAVNTTAKLIAEQKARNFVQHIAPIMQFGEMHTIYDTSDSPKRQGKRLGIVTRGVEGWLIEDAMVRLGPHGDERKEVTDNRRALGTAIADGLSVSHMARPEPHEKHANAIKMYFTLLHRAVDNQSLPIEYFLGYLAADVADFIMNTPFGHQKDWKDGCKLQVLSFRILKNHGLRVNLLVADAHMLDEARKWVSDMEEGLFEDSSND